MQNTDFRKAILYGFILMVLTISLYFPIINFQFITLDDPANVTGTYATKISGKTLAKIWFTAPEYIYTPVTTMFWMLQGNIAINKTAKGPLEWEPFGEGKYANRS